MMRLHPLLWLFLTACLLWGWPALGAELAPADFLAEVRRPLRTNAWGEITGRLTYKAEGSETVHGAIRVRMTFTPESLHAQLVLNDVNVYGFEQKHDQDGGAAETTLELPPHEQAPGLFAFGVAPEDLTFAFIYWDFVEELPRQKSRQRDCRVMRLADPGGNGTVQVSFSAAHGFPLEAWWYRQGEDRPWRQLELKGAKKHDDGLWFVKEMRLEGPNWKTRVVFDHAEINQVGEPTKK
ncbi:MAG: hypothetical protein GX937_13305 [Lentisphaerae bacterium]|jgi:hypothetical protein|nr:hypothetical protein [Lentisphaerota bacterium]